jgi:antitoxin component of MazEF toxin-antitoxin module
MPKMRVRGGKLTVAVPEEIRDELAERDGREIDIRTENGRIVLTPVAEEPLPGELEAIDTAKAEFARGETRRLDDVLNGMGHITRAFSS